MRIGARADDSDTVWATIDGDDRLFVLADSVARQFDKSADELRDKTVIRARRDASPRITWSENEARIVVVASGQRDWVVEEPADFQPDPRELGLAANSLMNLQASEVRFEERPRFPKAGPQIELTTDEQTQVLSISPEPDEEGRYLATVAGKEPVFVLRGAVVERLLRTFRGEPTDEPQ